jgi:hypothetical protein
MGTLGLVPGRARGIFLSPNRLQHVGVWRGGGGIKEPGRESDSMGSRLRMLGALSPLLQGVMLNYTQGKKTFNSKFKEFCSIHIVLSTHIAIFGRGMLT